MGMYYKANAYLSHWGINMGDASLAVQAFVVILAAVEFMLGMHLLLGMRKRFATTTALVFMVVMTLATVYVYVYDPVPDCGCFGAAFTLTNGQTLVKNIVLLVAATIVMWRRDYLLRLISERNQWITSMYSWVYILLLSFYSFHYLPLTDFTPFKVGTDLRKAYYHADAATSAALVGFDCSKNGESLTDSLLQARGITFLLTLPDIAHADDGCNDRINDIYDACKDAGYHFYGVVAYGVDSAAVSAWIDRTGAIYPFLQADADQLRAMVRSNPGLFLINNGVIAAKWSNNDLPHFDGKGEWVEHDSGVLENLSLLKLVLWFIIPLTVIILTDRLWIGRKFYLHNNYRKRLNLKE